MADDSDSDSDRRPDHGPIDDPRDARSPDELWRMSAAIREVGYALHMLDEGRASGDEALESIRASLVLRGLGALIRPL